MPVFLIILRLSVGERRIKLSHQCTFFFHCHLHFGLRSIFLKFHKITAKFAMIYFFVKLHPTLLAKIGKLIFLRYLAYSDYN
jgi:hypothetical protein